MKKISGIVIIICMFTTIAHGANGYWDSMIWDQDVWYSENFDADGDGMEDDWEVQYFGDAASRDGSGDYDSDGLTDLEEYENGTAPDDIDSDDDHFTDAREIQDNTDPNDPDGHMTIGPFTGRVPDTGQTTSYTDAFGEDADYLINAPAFIKMDDSGAYLPDSAAEWAVVQDLVTGLIWEVKHNKDDVENYDDPNDADNRYSWYDSNLETNGGDAGEQGDGTDTEDYIAALNAANYGGFNDWRLPTEHELQTIKSAAITSSTESLSLINREFFPSCAYWYYGSSTTHANYWSSVWFVDFRIDTMGFMGKSDGYCVRAVRGSRPLVTNNLAANDDGTVTDKNTGLMWGNDSVVTGTWESALASCEASGANGYDDWRLPSAAELLSIVDYGRKDPAVDDTVFTNTVSEFYWAATLIFDGSDRAWIVNFLNGWASASTYPRNLVESDTHYMRLVRGGQPYVDGNLFITSPLQASFWGVGDAMSIAWDTAGITGTVSIELSRDGGLNYETIAETTGNSGAYAWTVTGPATVNCALKIIPGNDPSKATVQSLFTIYGDEDGDGMEDLWEAQYFGDATSRDGSGDYDSDGLTDLEEFQNGTAPDDVDSDDDHFTDAREIQDNTDPNDPYGHMTIGPFTGRVPDTGQTQCFKDIGAPIACPEEGEHYYGQDAHFLINEVSYIKMDSYGNYLPDGALSWAMIQDLVTGLIWEVKNSKDNVQDYNNPNDADNTYSWYDPDSETNGGNAGTPGENTDSKDFIDALNNFNFGGRGDWRMPTPYELATLVRSNIVGSDPKIDTAWFPGTIAGCYYSSKTRVDRPACAWWLDFSVPKISTDEEKSHGYHVRAICDPTNISRRRPVNNGDGSVTDVNTGLMWRLSAIWKNWLEALDYCENSLDGGYDDWRMPNRNENLSLVDYERFNPAIDLESFPGTFSLYYLTSTTNENSVSQSEVWRVHFEHGGESSIGKTSHRYTRPVRGGQPYVDGNLFITSPLQASFWDVGDAMPINWDTAGITGTVSIELSRDGGLTYESIEANSDNSGSYSWTVSSPGSINCALKITPANDASKATVQSLFTIVYDLDDDGMDDAWEIDKFGDITASDGTADSDSDGLKDLEEFQEGTDPTDPDSDDDGVNDGDEISHGTNPNDGNDYDHAPNTPSTPGPADIAVDMPVTSTLTWVGGDSDDGDSCTYTVYFDTAITPTTVLTTTAQAFAVPSDLELATTYYWQVVSTDGRGVSTEGPVWSFTTVKHPSCGLSFTKVGEFTFPQDVRTVVEGIYLDGPILYIGAHVGSDTSTLEVVDVSDPANISVIGSLALGSGINRKPASMEKYENYLVIGDNQTSTCVVDISSPSSPVLKDTLDLDMTCTAIAVYDDQHFFVGVGLSTYGGLRTVDWSDSENLGQVKAISGLNQAGYQFDLVGDVLFTTWNYTDVNFRIFDVSDPTDPSPLGSLSIPGESDSFSVKTIGNKAYIVSQSYFNVVDVSDASDPVIEGSCAFTLDKQASSLTLHGDYAFTSRREEGMQALNISDPAHPDLAGRVPVEEDMRSVLAHAVSEDGQYLYVTSFGGPWPPAASTSTNKLLIYRISGLTECHPNSAPYTPSSPSPEDLAANAPLAPTLSWTGGDPDVGEVVTHTVYFGTAVTPTEALTTTMETACVPGELGYETDYYWQVVSTDSRGVSTAGPIWRFTTIPVEADGDGDGMDDVWEIQYFGDETSRDGSGDYDNDGLTDLEEFQNGTDPDDIDSDDDQFTDAREIQDNTDPNDPDGHITIGPFTGRVPDTGQTTSHTDAFGHDSDYLINAPAFIKMDDSGAYLPDSAAEWAMVQDLVTGLIWEMKNSSDDVADFDNPHDADNLYTWYDSNPETNGGNAGEAGDGTDTEDFISALNAACFGGHSDWRLPLPQELQSIVNYEGWPGAFDFFLPIHQLSPGFWSAATLPTITEEALCVRFNYGSLSHSNKDAPHHLRAVCGGADISLNDFFDNGDGTVTDAANGLMWQQSMGESRTWEDALSYAEGLSLGGFTDWRLPTTKEFVSVADYNTNHPALDTHFFGADISGYSFYWLSTTYAEDHAWHLWIFEGTLGEQDKTDDYLVIRSVRGGQPYVDGNLFITSPLQASFWDVGDAMPIEWDTAGISGTVEIALSRDGGLTYEILEEAAVNNGTYEWLVTGGVSVNCAIKITPSDDSSKATEQSLFSIGAWHESGLIAYYPMDMNFHDQGPSGLDGENHGAEITEDRFGNALGAMAFDGASSYGVVSDVQSLRLSGTDYTISCWFYIQEQTEEDNQALVFKRGPNQEDGYMLAYSNETGLINFYLSMGSDAPEYNNPYLTSVSQAAIGAWNHVVVTYSLTSGTGAIYLNGVKQEEGILPTPSAGTDSDLYFGRESHSSVYWLNGALDDVRIYNRALSVNEASRLYDQAGIACSMEIEGGASSTTSINLDLALSASSSGGVCTMEFSEDGRKWDSVLPFSEEVQYTVSPVSGERTLYARFSDYDGFTSAPVSATISLENSGYRIDADPIDGFRQYELSLVKIFRGKGGQSGTERVSTEWSLSDQDMASLEGDVVTALQNGSVVVSTTKDGREYRQTLFLHTGVVAIEEWETDCSAPICSNNTPISATAMINDQFRAGYLEADDIDCFSFALEDDEVVELGFVHISGPEALRFSILATAGDNSFTIISATAELNSPSIGQLALNSEYSPYTIALQQQEGYSGESAQYRLIYKTSSAQEMGYAIEFESNNALEYATPLEVGSPMKGSLQATGGGPGPGHSGVSSNTKEAEEDSSTAIDGDRDYYRITLGASSYMDITLESLESDRDLKVILYRDSEENLIMDLTSEGGLTASSSIGLSAGDYYYKVFAPNNDVDPDHHYFLSVNASDREDLEIEVNNTIQTATPIGSEMPRSGSINHASDADYYGYAQEVAGPVLLYFNALESASGFRVQIIRRSGTILGTWDIQAGKDKDILFNPGITGEFFIVVTGLDGENIDAPGNYAISFKSGVAAPLNVLVGVTVQADETSIDIGGSIQLTAFAEFASSPTQALDASGVIWTSQNPQVATVNDEGLVNGVISGTATIVAGYQGFANRVDITVAGGEFKDVKGDLLLVTGGGYASSETGKEAYLNMSHTVYRIFSVRLFDDDDIFFIHPWPSHDLDGDGLVDPLVDNVSSNTNDFLLPSVDLVEEAVKTIQENSDSEGPLYVFLIDHGGPGKFEVYPGEVLYAGKLKELLDDFQEQTNRPVIVGIDCCMSGSFISELTNGCQYSRLVMTSSNINELTYFNLNGRGSFTQFLMNELYANESVELAFYNTCSALKKAGRPLDKMSPQIKEVPEGCHSLGNTHVGGNFGIQGLIPHMLDWTQDTVIQAESKTSLSLFCDLSDPDGMEEVFAVVVPPCYSPPTVLEEFSVARIIQETIPMNEKNQAGRFEGVLNNLAYTGDYSVTFYARNTQGMVSAVAITVEVQGGRDCPEDGDLDGNGRIDVSDAIAVLQIMGGEPPSLQDIPCLVDTNGDQHIDLQDAVFIMHQIANGE
ncbi:protein of unknown function DUF1566 [Desulfatibacillum aliphaticivorans]|uniref:Fibronectin type-III domain-containing protein n=1 Tax=Desulfatibacillum aliphaticivorans TaxID=218208 RepID=B8FF04_DESAL|nr:DUF1566 domain-containing protein [Desulfatibacillum aliphaticivorans]ACL03821.1 protein of unknown function DUF1566 [Desulfatibacillum aliphaticivorans]